ncbi:MAG: type II toxin-antitoxin system PemK/MazF family toxin [Nitrosopumilus sp.]
MMKSGIQFERGEIILVPFPFTDISKSKLRPVLIISHTSYNKTSSDFICCGITSNLNNKNNSVLLSNVDMKDGTIQKKSRIKFANVFTLQKDLAIKRIGQINSKKLNIVISSITNLIS